MNSMDSLEPRGSDRRLSSPAAQRNREPILAVLRSVLPSAGRVLEIASGSGEHAVYFARHLAPLCWQPTDPSETALASIAAWRETEALDNLAAPVRLDVMTDWPPLPDLKAVVCINLLHISPWAASEALFAAAGRQLPVGGALVVYGPFRRHGEHTAPSNAAFDEQLRTRDPRWGIRDLEAVEGLARDNDLKREAVHELPANNLCVVWRR